MDTGALATSDDFMTVAVAGAVHQLRTPLSVVVGFTELIGLRLEDADSDELRSMLDVVARNAARMDDLVEDLLVLATARRCAPTAVLSDTVAMTALEAAADSARARGVAVQVSCPEGLRLETDPVRLEQLVATLVDNACLHGRPPVTITADVDPHGISIGVSDAGAGVSQRDVPGLFQLFSTSDTGPRGSHGLGLYTARRSARLLGGDLYYVARPYGGSFVLKLPVGQTVPR